MEPKRLFNGELRLLSIIWANEPVASGELVRLCMQELGWKKSTTYTMLKRLGEKGLLQNENTVVTSLVSRAEVQAAESECVVQQTFGGSLPGRGADRSELSAKRTYPQPHASSHGGGPPSEYRDIQGTYRRRRRGLRTGLIHRTQDRRIGGKGPLLGPGHPRGWRIHPGGNGFSGRRRRGGHGSLPRDGRQAFPGLQRSV